MKLLFLDQFGDLGGAQLCLLDLLPDLRREGWEAHVAAPAGGPLAGRLRALGVEFHELPLRGYSLGRKGVLDVLRFLGDVRRLGAKIRGLAVDIGPDAIYVNGPRLMPAVAHCGAGRPVVFHSHNLVTGRGSRLLVSRAIAHTGALVIAASRFVGRQWSQSQVVYGGVEGPPREPRFRRDPSPIRIGMIGRIAPQKGQLQFVAAAHRLAGSTGAEFVLCGDALFGDPAGERYRDRVRRSASGRVEWLGWRDDVYEVLGGLDLLVAPSAGEGGVPRVLLEAFAAGVPALALDSGAVQEAVEDGRNGFLLASSEPAEIARRISEILSQRERLEKVAAHARGTWLDRFTRRRYAAGICGLLRRWDRSGRAIPGAARP
jgi:glycosyltransferase involved in cell wall biosynthesis